ncbi:transcriptional regulator [Streptomyces sp. Ru87]|uniref:transcriptional regulator n=1 Tax=Streptomyces sp. Ru87 TaxID=2044307 RepID=UPI000BF9CF6A|nr:transcriptional regulator [Streptomyces sp. Ru87]PGH49700.1 transcriptional regulator [Streptomyces sp. Ru87]
MSEISRGGTAYATPDDRRRRLATILADLIPGAARIRVSLRAPAESWPHPHARAYDIHGSRIELKRAQVHAAARWIMRAHPETPWNESYDFDLTRAELTPAARTAGRLNLAGQGC